MRVSSALPRRLVSGGAARGLGERGELATQTDQDQDADLHLIDLGSGADRATRVTLSSDQDPGGGAMVWSPYRQWLFVATAAGRIVAVDRAGRARTLDTRLPAITQLATR